MVLHYGLKSSLNIFESEMLLLVIVYFHQVSATYSTQLLSKLPDGQSPSIQWDLWCFSVWSLPALNVLWRKHIHPQWGQGGTCTWQWYLVYYKYHLFSQFIQMWRKRFCFEFHQRYAFWIPIGNR